MDVESLFTHLRARAGARDEHANKCVTILGAIQATVDAAGSPASAASSPTAYFGALMTALERGGLSHATEVFTLLSLVLPHVPVGVIAQKAAHVVSAFVSAVASAAVVKAHSALRPALACVGHVLKALCEVEDAWGRPEVARLFSATIAFSSDERPKVRKAAQAAVLDVLASQRRAGKAGDGGASAIAATAFVDALRGFTQRELTRTLQLIPLLRAALPLLAPSAIVGVVEELLRLPALGLPRLTGAVYECLAALLESEFARLTVSFCRRLAVAMLEAGPSVDDATSTVHYAYALASCLTRLASMERLRAGVAIGVSFPRAPSEEPAAAPPAAPSCPIALSFLPGTTSTLCGYFVSDRADVQHAVANALAIILVALADGGAVAQAANYAAGAAVHGAPIDLGPHSTAAASAPASVAAAPPLVLAIARLRDLTQVCDRQAGEARKAAAAH